jgi:hypothetical protein
VTLMGGRVTAVAFVWLLAAVAAGWLLAAAASGAPQLSGTPHRVAEKAITAACVFADQRS